MKKSSLDRRGRVLKLALLFGNCAFAAIGLGVMAVGIFFSADKLYFVSPVFGITILTAAAKLFIAGGIMLFVISFFGCLGALYEKRILLFIYFLGMLVVFMLLASAACLAIVFRTWVRDQIRTYMSNAIQNYYGINLNQTYNAFITNGWDSAQQKWYCCGVDDQSWNVYRSSRWYALQPGVIDADKSLVPPSCCKKNQYGDYVNVVKCQTFFYGPPYSQSSVQNEALFYRGCYTAGSALLYELSSSIIAIGLIISMILIGGIVISLYLYRVLA